MDPAGVMRAAEETERQKLFEGDMKLSQQQLMQLHSRKFIPFESYLWTEEVNGNGIPYAIDDGKKNSINLGYDKLVISSEYFNFYISICIECTSTISKHNEHK